MVKFANDTYIVIPSASVGTRLTLAIDNVALWAAENNLKLITSQKQMSPCSVVWIRCASMNLSDMRSLQFTVERVLIKLFRTCDNVILDSCMVSFGLATVSELVDKCNEKA